MTNQASLQRASQRALARGRGHFRPRPPRTAFRWDGWLAGPPVDALERLCEGRGPVHEDCGHELRDHGWLSPGSIVCPGAWLLANAGEVRVFNATAFDAEVVSATRWSSWKHELQHLIMRLQTDATELHISCGCPLREHGLAKTGLVCPGDWVVTGADCMRVLRPAAFFWSYEAVDAPWP
jgi:hypothetical protein